MTKVFASIKTTLTEATRSLQAVSETPTLDAEVLLSQVLGKERVYLRTWPDQELNPDQISAFHKLLWQRQNGKPIAYIIGYREFWSRNFLVTPSVLIPRPETELLVELSLTLIPEHSPFNILDLGTGSGIIAITLAADRPEANIIATDISPAALTVAKQNADKHRVTSVRFFQGDWFNNLPPEKFDLIVSNPPYLANTDCHLNQGDLRFEPTGALIADSDGMADLIKIAENSCSWLKSGGYLVLEHGYDQALAVQNLLTKLGYCNIKTHPDLAGLPRVTIAQHKGCK